MVLMACRRHLKDVAEGSKRGLQWMPEKAQRAIDFFRDVLRLPETDGKPFILEPWQKFIVGSLFGWMDSDGYRRFRTAYIEIGKGSGKSPMAGGIGLYMLCADGEPSAECYAAATTREQAGILFQDAVKMVDASPLLSARIQKSGNRQVFNLAHLASGSYFRPVSSEGKGLDGKRVHYAALDEIHEHPTAIVVDKMRAGTKGRKQALIFEITNSGFNRESVCYYHHEYSRKVLEGITPNDTWFSYVCTLDPCSECAANGKTQPDDKCDKCDDWKDEKVWPKVNPNLGVSISHKYLREQVNEALGMPSKENIVKRLNFCLWTEQDVRAIPMDKWDECSEPAVIEHGEPCWLGLDMAAKQDIASACLVAPPVNGKPWRLVPFFWIDEDTMRERVNRDRVPYDVWARDGFITVTPGNCADFDFIRKDINALREKYNIQEIAKDPWNTLQLGTQLMSDGFTVVDFQQGMKSMTDPTKEIIAAVGMKNIAHSGNPVLRWMASNLATSEDAAGNLKPDKEKSTEKIDGVVAAIMGIGRAMLTDTNDNGDYFMVFDPMSSVRGNSVE